jgi:hypothetical protein
MYSGKKSIKPKSKIISTACFYLAAFNMNEKERDIGLIEGWIKKV